MEELPEEHPLKLSWNAIYALVLGMLVVDILFLFAFSQYFK